MLLDRTEDIVFMFMTINNQSSGKMGGVSAHVLLSFARNMFKVHDVSIHDAFAEQRRIHSMSQRNNHYMHHPNRILNERCLSHVRMNSLESRILFESSFDKLPVHWAHSSKRLTIRRFGQRARQKNNTSNTEQNNLLQWYVND